MKFGLPDTTIESIQQVFETDSKIDEVIVFGSRAKGNYKEGSDIDFAVKGRNVNLDDILGLSRKLDEINLPYKIDLINYATINDKDVVEHIDRVGIAFYERWKKYKLEDLAKVQTGPFGSQLHMSDYKTSGTPIITVEHLGENKIIHENLPLVGAEDKERLKKYILKEGDIVFSRVGSVDRSAYVSAKEEGWMFSGRCLRVRTNDKVDSRFLSYYFSQESFREHIRMIAVGATMPSINTTILSEVKLSVPPLVEQKRIAENLCCLDNKIDLLQRQNKTLEQLAETLFRQWFVEEGDEKKKIELGKIADVTTGKGLKQKEFIENGIYPILGANGEMGRTNSFLTDEKLILTGRVGTLGKVYISKSKVWISDNVLIVKPKEDRFFYPIYFSLRRVDFENLNSGSTQPLVTQTEVKKIDLIIPSDKTLKDFSMQSSIYFEKINKNQNQIKTLTQLRETLLPKLMSGEVRAN